MNAFFAAYAELFPYSNFLNGYLIFTILFLCHLKKRRMYGLRMAGSIAGIFLMDYLLNYFQLAPSLVLVCGIFLIAMTMLIWFCCKVSFTQALYSAICAYAAEHSTSVITFVLLLTDIPWLGGSGYSMIRHVIIYLIMFVFWERAVFRKLQQNGKLRLKTRSTLISGIILFFVVSVLFYGVLETMWIKNSRSATVYALMYDELCCSFFLWLQVLQQKSARFKEDLQTERLLRQRQAEQYSMTKENIALIERKCHDLKHQVAALRAIDNPKVREKSIQEIEKAILIYGAVMKTGSDVLDTVLTDKYLFCEEHGISWTCMADGSKLDFMDPVDLYVLFANALDNAIEAVEQLADPTQRAIGVTVYTKFNMAFLQIENYYKHSLVYENNLPKTTKEKNGSHGYGLRSIQYTVEKYGGTMQIQTENQIFLLHIVIPLP